MSEELQPCPFKHEGFSGGLVVVSNGVKQYSVLCDICGAEGPTGKTETEAIESWNRRETGN